MVKVTTMAKITVIEMVRIMAPAKRKPSVEVILVMVEWCFYAGSEPGTSPSFGYQYGAGSPSLYGLKESR